MGAGPGARDLLTFRAVERLQEADVIFYDRLVDTGVLELARRDAERVFVGKVVGASAWPQSRIDAVIVAAARQGKRVVRLKSGDPGIFGRAAEELDAARRAGIPAEIVPGVTAASAAAAAMGRPLTERGRADRPVLATGMGRDGTQPGDIGAMARPGTTLALYMSVRQSAGIAAGLLTAGCPPAATVTVVANASRPDQRILRTALADLGDSVARSAICSPAIILVDVPEAAAVPAQACA